jgi:two-component system cell cycle response regulator
MTLARILLVDDVPSVRYRYEVLLRNEGFEVDTASLAEEALEMLRGDRRYHLVISDLIMPGIGGLALVREIRETPRFEMLPVLVFTGSREKEDVVSNLQAGASDYVAKNCDEVEFFARVRNLARTGVLQESLDKASRTDELTQLANRRHGTQRLDEEVSRSRRYDRSLAVALLDIDHFKKVNDTHGHQAGDEVLIAVSSHLKSASRDSDCAIRWGGEEFLLVFPETSLEEAAGIVERFRSQVESSPTKVVGGAELSVTVSGGVARLEPDDTIESLVARADAALYRAKELGRNQLLLAESGEFVPMATV